MAGSKRAPGAKADPEPAPAEEAAAASESPVVALLSKRLRNLRKKLKNVEALEAMQRDNKELNPEQARRLPALTRVRGPTRDVPLRRRLASPRLADAPRRRSCLLLRRRAP